MVYLIVICVLGGFLYIRKARPAQEKSGYGFNPIPQGSKKISDQPTEQSIQKEVLLKVATYNIQTGKNANGQRDISKSAELIESSHIVGIQEVYAPSWLNRFGIGLSQSQHLAMQGGFTWLFNATRLRWLREHRGNALLSKLPMSEWHTKMLPDQSGKSYRNITIAKAEWNGKGFHILNTHLHTKNGRKEQIEVVLREFSKYSPAILLGDFNCTGEELGTALSDIEISDAIKIAQLDPQESQRIDWILTKGFVVEGGDFHDKGVSDHPFYQVNLS